MGAMCTAILFSIILGLVVDVNAQTKITLDTLEQNLEWLEKKVDNLEEELEFGGKNYETVQYTSK